MKALVFGGSGWTGRVLVPRLRDRGYEVFAPSHGAWPVEQAREDLRREQPDVVVNLAAAQPGASEERLELVNVVGAAAVARGAAEAGARLVHVSSDLVLDGADAPYADEAPRHPLTDYGRSKADGERRVLEAHPSAVAVRTSLLWDPAEIDRSTQGFVERLSGCEPCSLYTDEIRCPLPRTVLAEALIDLIEVPWAGTLNVAGAEAVSRHEFGTLLLAHFRVPGRDRIGKARYADRMREGAPARPLDVRLDVRRAESLLGRRLPGVREILRA